MSNIMRSDSIDFEDLCEKLYKYITFDPVNLSVKGCDGTLDKTRSILKEHFPQYDITKTIKYFESEG